MIAIYKRELKSFFHSFIGWLYLAVMLFMMGIYFMVLNMLSGYPTISYVLQSVVFLLIITVPILTMRTLAEERKYKTDQLILTAPVSVGKIVMGKFLALVTMFAIPVFVIGMAPILLMRAGEFQAGTSYTSLLGFFLYGCLGLAIGLFMSSLTESIVIAAVLSFATMFLGYIMSGLCNVISSSGTSKIAEYIAKLLRCFDMVGRFDALCNGYFQVESVAYFVTATAFVLFCTTQSIQKRRYAVAGRGVKLGAYSIVNILLTAALTIAVNLGLNYVPDQYTSFDVTANKLYTLTEDTERIIGGLSQDVTINVLSEEAAKDEDLDRTLQQFKGLSKHIKVEYIDPIANPKFYYKYTDTEPSRNSLIVVGPSGDTVVDYNDIYAYEPNYTTYSYEIAGYDGEGQLLSAIMRVTTDDIPKFYIVTGHDELVFDEKFLNALAKENVTYENLSLHTVDEIPEDARGIILNAPVNDYSEDDTNKVLAYLEQGGNALIIPTWTGTSMEQFEKIMGYYGVSVVDGVIAERDRSYYYQNPYNLFPEIEEGDLTEKVSGGTVLAPLSRGLTYPEDVDDVSYQPFLTTSENAFSKTDMMDGDNYRKGEEDIDGPFVIGLKVRKCTESGGESQAVIVATEQMFTAMADEIVPGYNVKLFGSVIASLADREDSVAIPVKYYAIGYLAFNAQVVYIVGFVSVILLPLLCLVNGLIIWLSRRKK
ncbi:MAG: Gldg family protein [Lachnospiraceae bacterium]|nr:Gldg family protein [Lachnospiraceae bacterium]